MNGQYLTAVILQQEIKSFTDLKEDLRDVFDFCVIPSTDVILLRKLPSGTASLLSVGVKPFLRKEARKKETEEF